jgi:hypothetical protein
LKTKFGLQIFYGCIPAVPEFESAAGPGWGDRPPVYPPLAASPGTFHGTWPVRHLQLEKLNICTLSSGVVSAVNQSRPTHMHAVHATLIRYPIPGLLPGYFNAVSDINAVSVLLYPVITSIRYITVSVYYPVLAYFRAVSGRIIPFYLYTYNLSYFYAVIPVDGRRVQRCF